MIGAMNTRSLRRWLDAHDPQAVVFLAAEAVVPAPQPAPESAPARTGLAARMRGARSREAAPPQVAVRLPAAAELEAADLLAVLAHAERVDLVPAGPTDQQHEVVAYAAEVAAMCGLPGRIAVVEASAAAGAEVFDLERIPLGRRALLGAPDRPIPPDADSPQRRLVEATVGLLRAAGRSVATVDEAEVAPPTGSVRLRAKGCVGDGLCVRVCPHDALRLERTELTDPTDPTDSLSSQPAPPLHLPGSAPRGQVQFRLVHTPVDCSACGRCVEMCPSQALTVAGEHAWTDLLTGHRELTLRTGLERPCARCGAAHGRPGVLCATCTEQQKNPFSVRLPPGFTLPGTPG